jgi:hypothetical protein
MVAQTTQLRKQNNELRRQFRRFEASGAVPNHHVAASHVGPRRQARDEPSTSAAATPARPPAPGRGPRAFARLGATKLVRVLLSSTAGGASGGAASSSLESESPSFKRARARLSGSVASSVVDLGRASMSSLRENQQGRSATPIVLLRPPAPEPIMSA